MPGCSRSGRISGLYGVSIGAWLGDAGIAAEKPEKALLVSPVVDMETLILSMMQAPMSPKNS